MANGLDMTGRGGLEHSETMVSQLGPDAAAIRRARGALDQPGLLHPGDGVGQPGTGLVHSVGQLRHSDATVFGLGQGDQDLVLTEIEPELKTAVDRTLPGRSPRRVNLIGILLFVLGAGLLVVRWFQGY